MHPSYTAVTLEQLLRHRSGLGRIMDRNDRWAGWHRKHRGKSATEQRRLFVAAALKPPPRYPPETDEYYTNDAYLIAGSLLERAAGVDWETLVRSGGDAIIADIFYALLREFGLLPATTPAK